MKEDVSIKFKHEGSKVQYKFNEETLDGLNKLYKQIPQSQTQAVKTTLVLIEKVKSRSKLIRIADTSLAGWSTVREYETNDIASDSEDEKKIRQAEGRAMLNMKSKSRSAPYKVPNQKPAETYGNTAYNNQFQRQPFRAGNKSGAFGGAVVATQQDTMVRSRETETVVNDKYKDFDFCTIEHQNSDDIEFCVSQIHYFEERSYEKVNFHGVKGRLSKHVKFWEEIGAN